jgi:hypothetical protein
MPAAAKPNDGRTVKVYLQEQRVIIARIFIHE